MQDINSISHAAVYDTFILRKLLISARTTDAFHS